MFHATVRTDREAFHFIGDVDPYNLQTLQEHVRGARQDGDGLCLRIEVDAQDEGDFARYAQRWLRRLKNRGVRVELRVEPIPIPNTSPPWPGQVQFRA